MAIDGWDRAASIDDVLERMDRIESDLPQADGVAFFNRMYREVTRLVDSAVDAKTFKAGQFLARLDVNFANLFFAAYAASLSGDPIPPAWAPLFEARTRERVLPIQFALAGMNAHISHDLPFAVVTTCRELGVAPLSNGPEHSDFTHTNDVLDHAQGEIKTWFSIGPVAVMDHMGGRVDDGFATFGIHTARAAAWETSELLWRLEGNAPMDEMFKRGLGRSVGLASRGILL